jgi:hypothetical protein
VPWALLLAWATSAALALEGRTFYIFAFLVQTLFYVLAGLGALWGRTSTPPRLLAVPSTFCLLNLAAVSGLSGFLRGSETAHWKKRS